MCKSSLKKLPRLIESNQCHEIEKLLVSCGSFQVASNFSDLVHFFDGSRDRISKIIEAGTFNFASSTLINCLKRENTFFYGFDNWEMRKPECSLNGDRSFLKTPLLSSNHEDGS